MIDLFIQNGVMLDAVLFDAHVDEHHLVGAIVNGWRRYELALALLK
jgi:hypothetical protein